MEGDSQRYVLLNLFQHLFLKIVVDKTLKRVQGDDPLRRFQVSFDSARNDETTGDNTLFSFGQ